MRYLYVLLFTPIFFGACQDDFQTIQDDKLDQFNEIQQDPFIARLVNFQEEVKKAKWFLREHKDYNQELVFLIDMKIPSGKFRLFLYDLNNDSIKERGLVAHGSGSVYSEDSLEFSNIPNSYQSSLGYYKIGQSYSGNFGKSYKLHGLDKTNNKAFQRYVVFHPYSCVPDTEQDFPICESLGCPMVSNRFMSNMYPIIDGSKKPILMVIYY